MASDQTTELTTRQRVILAEVVTAYVATGQPVGSKQVVERAELVVSPSTVRNELAELEARGLLTHPHTSAGRVPTERGYRFYADEVLRRQDPRPGPGSFPLDLSALRREVDSALHATTEMLDLLKTDYGLTKVAASHLLGQVVRYDVGNVFDPAFTVACRVAKKWLPVR